MASSWTGKSTWLPRRSLRASESPIASAASHRPADAPAAQDDDGDRDEPPPPGHARAERGPARRRSAPPRQGPRARRRRASPGFAPSAPRSPWRARPRDRARTRTRTARSGSGASTPKPAGRARRRRSRSRFCEKNAPPMTGRSPSPGTDRRSQRGCGPPKSSVWLLVEERDQPGYHDEEREADEDLIDLAPDRDARHHRGYGGTGQHGGEPPPAKGSPVPAHGRRNRRRRRPPSCLRDRY